MPAWRHCRELWHILLDPNAGQLQAVPLSVRQSDADRCWLQSLVANVPASDVDDGHLLRHADVPVAADVSLGVNRLQRLRSLGHFIFR